MSAFQIAQGLQGMTNYTMPKPWRWTWLGYYHMLYMGSQFTYMLFYFIALYHAWQKGQVTAAQKRDLAAIAGMIALFAGILAVRLFLRPRPQRRRRSAHPSASSSPAAGIARARGAARGPSTCAMPSRTITAPAGAR